MYDNDFYKSLKKPEITPPAKVFKYVWIILYLMMFTALYLVIKTPENVFKTFGILFFTLQFILNILWSPVFFVFKKMETAFVICIVLTVFVGATVYCFLKISLLATFLMIPYLMWSVFACFLLRAFILNNK